MVKSKGIFNYKVVGEVLVVSSSVKGLCKYLISESKWTKKKKYIAKMKEYLSLETMQGGIKFNCYLAFLGRLRKTWLKSHAYVIKTGFCLSVCLLQLNVPTLTK